MKVLQVHNFYQRPGGEDAVFRAEGALLEAHGHTVLRYTRHNDDVEGMGRAELLRRSIRNPETERELGALVRRERPDIVHCHNTFPLVSPAAWRTAREGGAAVVQTLHNYRPVCPKAELMREGRPCEECLGRTFAWPAIRHGCYRGRAGSAALAAMNAAHRWNGAWNDVDRFIALTRFVRDTFVRGGAPAERIAVKPNFVPDHGGRPPEPGDGGGGHVVFVGRLSPEKGVATLLDAWARLEGDTRLVVLGDGPLAGAVERAAARDCRITWLGHRSPAAVMEAIGAAALLVMPSLWYETFGLCIAEAFSRGTPVIASRLGAMAELVDHGRTGWLVEPGRADALACAVEHALARPDLAPMRAAARAEYERRFSATANHAMLLDVYRDAMKHRLDDAEGAKTPSKVHSVHTQETMPNVPVAPGGPATHPRAHE